MTVSSQTLCDYILDIDSKIESLKLSSKELYTDGLRLAGEDLEGRAMLLEPEALALLYSIADFIKNKDK